MYYWPPLAIKNYQMRNTGAIKLSLIQLIFRYMYMYLIENILWSNADLDNNYFEDCQIWFYSVCPLWPSNTKSLIIHYMKTYVKKTRNLIYYPATRGPVPKPRVLAKKSL